jgi:lipopolysaccharide export system permease protein
VVFYVEGLSDDGKFMEKVFIQGQRQGNLNLMVAERGYQYEAADGSGKYLVLVDGYRYEGTPGTADFRIIKYAEHEVRIQPGEAVLETNQTSAMSSIDLWRSSSPYHLAELQWRLSMPVSALLLSMLAIFLSRTNPRQGRYAKFFLGILVYVVYSNLLGVARSLVEKGTVDPAVGIWWVHLLLIIVIVFFMVQHAGGFKAIFNRQQMVPST